MAQELLEKNGGVGSGMMCLDAYIFSKSSSIRFGKRTVGGQNKTKKQILRQVNLPQNDIKPASECHVTVILMTQNCHPYDTELSF